MLYERCELDRLGLVTSSELGGVSLGELAATHAAWAYLLEDGAESELERRVFRMLLGRQSLCSVAFRTQLSTGIMRSPRIWSAHSSIIDDVALFSSLLGPLCVRSPSSSSD